MAGQLGEEETAAFTLALNILMICFLTSWSISAGTGIHMATRLGEGLPRAASFVAKIGIVTAVCVASCVALLFALFINSVAPLVSKQVEVQDQLISLKWAGFAIIFCASILFPCVEVLTKQGRAHIVGSKQGVDTSSSCLLKT